MSVRADKTSDYPSNGTRSRADTHDELKDGCSTEAQKGNEDDEPGPQLIDETEHAGQQSTMEGCIRRS